MVSLSNHHPEPVEGFTPFTPNYQVIIANYRRFLKSLSIFPGSSLEQALNKRDMKSIISPFGKGGLRGILYFFPNYKLLITNYRWYARGGA